MLKCLVCYADLPLPPQQVKEDEITTTKTGGGRPSSVQKTQLAKHLDVIFILRNIFQVPLTQLSEYLKNCPKVDDWICICEKCNELVMDYRVIYNDMLEISRKIVEVKGGIIGIVKKSYDKPSVESQVNPIFLNITDECRRFINYHEYQWPVNPFTDGDLKALKLLNKQNSMSNDDDDDTSSLISKRSHIENDSILTTATDTTTSYPDDDHFSNDDDYFQDDPLNSDGNEDDDNDEPIFNCRPKTKRSHYKETSAEWKAPYHLKYETKPAEKLECPHCPTETFTNKTHLITHFNDNHPNELPPKQRKYPPEFYTISDSRKRRIRLKVPSQCPHCSKQFSGQDNLRSHIRFSHLNQFSFHCGICGIGRPTKKSLESHEAYCSKLEPPQKCPEEGCPFIVPVKVGLETHFRENHPERDLFSRCPECEEGLYTELGLERHLQRNHKESRPFKCDTCAMGFKTKQCVSMHKKRCHENGGEKAICDHCGASFGSQKYLNDHVKMKHEGEYDLRCDQCGLGYAKKELLKVHLFKKHGIGKVEDLKWRCAGVNGCGKVFWTKETLTAHVSLHHEEGKDPEFTCEECGKQFHRKASLIYHRKGIHESKLRTEKFKCEVCGAEFGFRDYLTRHKRTVHKIFPQKRM